MEEIKEDLICAQGEATDTKLDQAIAFYLLNKQIGRDHKELLNELELAFNAGVICGQLKNT